MANFTCTRGGGAQRPKQTVCVPKLRLQFRAPWTNFIFFPGANFSDVGGWGGGGCLPQPRWAVCATGAGAHQGQTGREGEKDMWWTVGTARGGTGHLGLTETQRGRLWTACGQRCVDSKNSQTTPATTSTTSVRQLLGATDAQTAHPATFSTAPTHQLLGSANTETTPARAPAAAADRTH